MLEYIDSHAHYDEAFDSDRDKEIDEFFKQFSPMLDSAQRKQLQQVVERLKKLQGLGVL